jgi:hypothetical protein
MVKKTCIVFECESCKGDQYYDVYAHSINVLRYMNELIGLAFSN